jgi:hypothetical protein
MGFCAISVGEEDSFRQGVKIASGDFLSGGAIRFQSEGIEVKPPWAQAEILVPYAEVRYWMDPRVLPEPPANSWVILTENGDQLTGTSLTLANGEFQMRSSWGQPVVLNRNQLVSLRYFPNSRIAFSGPSLSSPWQNLRHAYQVKPMLDIAGQINLPGMVTLLQSEIFSTPDPFMMECVFHPAGNSGSYMLSLFADLEGAPEQSISFTVSQDKVSARWMDPNMKERRRSVTWEEKIDSPGKVHHVRISGDSTSGKMTFSVNDTFSRTFEFPYLKTKELYEPGTIRIQSRSQDDGFQIEEIKVLKWSSTRVPAPNRGERVSDRLLLYDGSVHFGTIQEITPEKAVLKMEGETLGEFSLDRVYELVLAQSKEGKADVQIHPFWFMYSGLPGDRLSLRQLAGEKDRVLGRSVAIQEDVAVPLNQIQFLKQVPATEVKK